MWWLHSGKEAAPAHVSRALATLAALHSIDEEDYGGPTELMFEGLVGSFASFMVSGRGRGLLEGMGGSPCCMQAPGQTHHHCCVSGLLVQISWTLTYTAMH